MKDLLQRLLALIVAAGLVGMIFLIVLNNVVMPWIVDVPRITVPRLRGQTVRQARVNLARWGLKLAIRDSLHHDSRPAGTVLGQDPAPGKQIKRGRRISVDVSLGPRYSLLPESISGVSLREARLQLEAAQMVVGEIMYVSSATVPQGTILRSTPPPGTLLQRGTPVDLEVSSGAPDLPKPIPVLRGVPVEQVEDSLRKYEMRLGTITTRVDTSVAPGTVLAQSPAGGGSAVRRTPIHVVISAAPHLAPPHSPEDSMP